MSFCDNFTLFYHKSSFSLFAYCICVALNTSVRYDTILLPRCHFEFLDVMNFFSSRYIRCIDFFVFLWESLFYRETNRAKENCLYYLARWFCLNYLKIRGLRNVKDIGRDGPAVGVFQRFFSFSMTSLSAGSQLTVSSSCWRSHRAASCSLRCIWLCCRVQR